MLGLGASAGLPIMLVYQVLSGWLREAGVSRTQIGVFVLAGFAYSLKFLWAPLVDRLRVPGFSDLLGNRRGWTLFAVLGTALAMFAMSRQDPSTDLAGVAVCAVLIAFASATLDICVDAWRVDSAANDEQAMMSAVYQLGYRFGMIAAVSGGMFIAGISSFNTAYLSLGLLAIIGASTPLWAPKPPRSEAVATWDGRAAIGKTALGLLTLALVSAFIYFGMVDGGYLRIAGSSLKSGFTAALSPLSLGVQKSLGIGFLGFVYALPFIGSLYFLTLGRGAARDATYSSIPIIGDLADVVRRCGWMALVVFAIVASYRISDTTMGVMAMPLYIDLGYDKALIGTVKGAFGITVMIFGAIMGAAMATVYGMARTMIVGAILTIVTNLAFAWLASVETPRAIYLFVTIGADNIAAGFAGTIFIAFMSILTNKAYSATQYALFSSLFAFYGKSLAAFSGYLADRFEYEWFFIITALFGVPALILVIYCWLSGFTDSINERGEAETKLL